MRYGAFMRLTVLASLALLMSGQLCMLTTCVPRLHERATRPMHACCHPLTGAPAGPASDRDASRPGTPAGAMPCDQALSLADAPTLAAPQLLAVAPACAPMAEPTHVVMPAAVWMDRERDAGPLPGRDGPAPTGLRAPPIA